MLKKPDKQVRKWTARLSLSSLRTRLLLLGLFALLPAFGFIIFDLIDHQQQAVADAKADTLQLARLVATDLKQEVGSTRAQLLTLAQLPIVRRPTWVSLCNQTLAKLLSQHPRYAQIGVVDLNGDVRCSALPLKGRVNSADRTFFRRALETRDFSMGEYQIGRVSGKGGVHFSFPVLDETGQPMAVVFIALDLATLFVNLIENIPSPKGMMFLVVNEQGTILARHPEPARIGETIPDFPLIADILAQRGEGETITTGLDGVVRIYTFTPLLHAPPPSRAYVSVGIPEDDILAPAQHDFFRKFWLLLLIMAVVLTAAWVGGFIVVLRPVNALIDAAARLGRGNLSARTGLVHTAGELGQLARTFDEMAGSLEQGDKELRAAEAERRRSEDDLKLFRTLIDRSNDAIEVIDPETARFLDVNEKGCLDVGYSRAEFLSLRVSDIDPGVDPSSFPKLIEELQKSGSMMWNSVHRRKDGSTFPVEVNIKYVRLDRDYLIAVVRDVTERKQAEDQIRSLNAELEQRVIERTVQLTAANKELEAFSYSVSHDLRAPLRAIDGFSQAVLDDYADKLDDPGRDHLKRVRAATQHMGHLIDDLIKLARVTRLQMHRDSVDLGALAGDVLAYLQKSAPDRRVDCRIAPGLAAEGDARLLRVVLDNLLGNAWKFTGKTANARIEFGAMHGGDSAPGYFVRDNGAGFDMAYADKLFGAFQRLHTSDEFPGTGVGLATAQRIIHRHGGRIWAEGAVGKGATFYFTL